MLPPQPLLAEAHPLVRRAVGRAASAPRLGNGHRGYTEEWICTYLHLIF